MSKNQQFNDGASIEETIKRALNDGDLSELKNLGPAVQNAVNRFVFGSRSRDNIPYSTTYSASTQDTTSHNTAQGMPQGTGEPGQSPSAAPPPPYSYPPPQTGPVQAAPPTVFTKNPQRISRRVSKGILRIVFGSIGVFFFTPITLLSFAFTLAESEVASFIAGIVLTSGCAIFTLISAYFLVTGISKHGLASRIAQLSTLLQNKNVYTIDELAARTGRSSQQIKRDLRKIQKGNLIPEMYTDADETCVMWGQDTYDQYLKSEETRLEKIREEERRKQRLENPATTDIENFRSEGEAVILKIRAANDLIDGEEISAKLDTLEDTVIRIFTYVERYPEKLPSTRKFVNHYLPTTLKLVEKYQQYDRMDFEPQNVRQAKAEIERSLDTINEAFNNLLESLFVHDTLDVATDIKVLENMLEQEGLIGNTFKIDQSESSK